MAELMQASREWATRPDDERFCDLISMQAHFEHKREISKESIIDVRAIEAFAPDRNKLVLRSKYAPIPEAGVKAKPMEFEPSNWAFHQIALKAGAPVRYINSLPAPLAAQCLNHGLAHAKDEKANVLVEVEDGNRTIRSLNGKDYGRVWNADIVGALVRRFGDGVTGEFRVPGEFGRKLDRVTKANTTLFAGDRDMFVFLADEENRIELPNRRDGEHGTLARGFFVWNSEVGARTLGIASFLFDYACANRIVWGATEVREMTIRHRSRAPERLFHEMMPAMRKFAEASQTSTLGINNTLRNAQRKSIGTTQEDVNDYLAKFFTPGAVPRINNAHMIEEHRPIRTTWDAITGATAYAKTIQHQDARVEVERSAGKLLDLCVD